MQINKETLRAEIATYKSLSPLDKEQYLKKIESLEGSVYNFIETSLDEESRAIFEEQIRDLVYISAINVGGAKAKDVVVCSKKLAYEIFNNAIEIVYTTSTSEYDFKSGIVSTYYKNQEKRDEAIGSSDFIKYIRGYSRYWRDMIDENDCDEEYELPDYVKDIFNE